MMFVTVTGDHLILDTRRFAIYNLIGICVGATMTVTLHFQPPYLQYWQIPCYTVSFCVLGVTWCTFGNMFRSLFRAATLLNNCVKVRNSRKFMSEAISKHYKRFYSLIFIVFIFSLESYFNFFFTRRDLLRSVFKWRIITNYLGKSKKYRVCQKVWRQKQGLSECMKTTTGFVRRCEDNSLKQVSDTWQVFELGRYKY
jgi:hypothetical protein